MLLVLHQPSLFLSEANEREERETSASLQSLFIRDYNGTEMKEAGNVGWSDQTDGRARSVWLL